MKKFWIFLAVTLSLVGGLTACAPKTTFVLDWIISGNYAPFLVAQDMGFFKKAGLDLEYKRGFGSAYTIKQIATKVAPIGFADTGHLVNLRANNPDIKVKEVAIIHAKNLFTAVFLKEKGYKHPRDLAGAWIGSPQANPVRIIFPTFAKANGLNPCSVKWINLRYAQVMPALLSGQIDVVLLYATLIPALRASAAKIGKDIGYFSYGDWGVDIYSHGVIVHEDTMKSDPKFVRAAVKAVMDAWAWSLRHPEKAIKNVLKHAPGWMREPLIRGQFAIAIEHLFDEGVRRHGLGYIDHKKMDKTVELLTTLLKLKRRVPTEEMYTNRFLPQWPAIKAALGDKAM